VIEPGRIRVWDARDPVDYEAWVSLWYSSPDREPAAHPGYVRLFAAPDERPLCLVFRWHDGGNVLYPLIERDLARLAYPTGLVESAVDLITPYGYGGPLAWGSPDPDGLAAAYWAAHDAEMVRRSAVTEFARLSLAQDTLLPFPVDLTVRGRNVVRSLAPTEDELWRGVDHKVRKNVNKAVRSGLTVEIDGDGRRLETFLRLYHGTMDRRAAGVGYYFDAGFFDALNRDLAGRIAYAFTIAGGEAVSTELILISADRVYSFLGGTDASAFDLRPNDLLKYEVARWAKAAGKSAYVLGGGREPEDGIFRYKLAFAPTGAVPFHTAERIHDPRLFRQLAHDWSARAGHDAADGSTFFPPYRRPAPPPGDIQPGP